MLHLGVAQGGLKELVKFDKAPQDALGAESPDDEGSQGLGQQVVRTISSLQRFAKSLTR